MRTSLTILFFAACLSLKAQLPEKAYARFDFIPGEKVMFTDDFSNENPDEIPSFWEISEGRVETAIINGEKVLGFLDGGGAANLRLKKNTTLGSRITFEFEFLFRPTSGKSQAQFHTEGLSSGERIYIQFADANDWYTNRESLGTLENGLWIYQNGEIEFSTFSGKYSSGKQIPDSDGLYEELTDRWVRVSISVTENSLRIYLNAQRVLNAALRDAKPRNVFIQGDGVSAQEDGMQLFVRNVRLAEGGIDPYKTLSIDGRIIARGINFESGKATLKPESLGAVNHMVQMMTTYPDLKFEISGHTDSDGNDALNMTLSGQRAQAVKDKMVSLGIAADRLSTKGYGETKPIADNATQEGKANNRRVEFLKL